MYFLLIYSKEFDNSGVICYYTSVIAQVSHLLSLCAKSDEGMLKQINQGKDYIYFKTFPHGHQKQIINRNQTKVR